MMKKRVLRMIAHLILILTKYLAKKYPWRKQHDLQILLEVVLEKFIFMTTTMRKRLKSKARVHQRRRPRLVP